MRKITQQFATALEENTNLNKGNTAVEKRGHVSYGYLFGNRISARTDNYLCLTNAGWCTPTTKDRLNGLLKHFRLPYSISQCGYTWQLHEFLDNGEVITRQWDECTKITDTELGLDTFKPFVTFDLSKKKLV
jgi:hypothetical protein